MSTRDSVTDGELLNARLRQTIVKIQDSIEVERRTFQEMLGVSTSRYADIQFRKMDFSIKELYSLSNSLSLDLDLLYSGNIDYQALAKQFKGDLTALPERYQNTHQKMARARTIQIIFSHLCFYHGESYARAYLRRFQVRPEAFLNSTEFIHPKITTDLISGLSQENYSEDQIRGIGTMTLSMLPPLVKQKLKKYTPRNLYSYILEEYVPKQYDRIYTYKLDRISSERCRIISKSTELAKSIFSNKPVDNRETCLYRQGVFTSFYGVFGKRLAKIEEVSCIHRGDSQCVTDVVWD